ncbi:MAG TPA: helix-turn-helix domain-containing protein, partial [Acidimicrobiales bacterium]|nr:helix-turn-helix domain-containing protein [Acidimicrobiales bacterium]
MTATQRTAKGARAEATRRALLASARELFGERGFAPTSVDEVVRHAGVTKGALYHHFRDKDDLFRAVLEEVKLDVTSAAADSYFDAAEGDDPLHTVLLTCLAVIDAHLDP